MRCQPLNRTNVELKLSSNLITGVVLLRTLNRTNVELKRINTGQAVTRQQL